MQLPLVKQAAEKAALSAYENVTLMSLLGMKKLKKLNMMRSIVCITECTLSDSFKCGLFMFRAVENDSAQQWAHMHVKVTSNLNIYIFYKTRPQLIDV